ncbi:tRNA:m(4)X modification enzyme TRM13 [Mactra antiquata]
MSDKKKTPNIRPDPPEGSCHFYVERKKRYCRFHPAKDVKYCAEHASVFGVDLGRRRVTCPYNTKHTCYADKLNHHMKKCPDKPRDMPAYYSQGINSGDNGGEVVPDPKETVLTMPQDELEKLIERVNQLYDEHIGELSTDILSHPCLKEELNNPSYGTAAIRHRKQQASLIGQMEKLGLLTDGKCFLEMGAGKGQLSHWLHGAVVNKEDIRFVLIDRSHVRNKMDNLHKEENIMDRIRIDIEHLRLGEVPSIDGNNRGIVAFGKHLCGPATDLTLRCVTETLADVNEQHDSEDEVQRKRLKSDCSQLSGAVIALCCHHRCNWIPYVGKQFFKSCGLSARDYQVISSMSSWATCAWKGWSYQKKKDGGKVDPDQDTLSDDDDEHMGATGLDQGEIIAEGSDQGGDGNSDKSSMADDSKNENHERDTTGVEEKDNNTRIYSKLTQSEREVIGRKCKRLIDYGRVCYLRDHGMKSDLKIYIDEFYTPENVVLVATSN